MPKIELVIVRPGGEIFLATMSENHAVHPGKFAFVPCTLDQDDLKKGVSFELEQKYEIKDADLKFLKTKEFIACIVTLGEGAEPKSSSYKWQNLKDAMNKENAFAFNCAAVLDAIYDKEGN